MHKHTHKYRQAYTGIHRHTQAQSEAHRETQLNAQHLEILSIRIVVQVTARKGNRPSEKGGKRTKREREK